MLGVFPLINAIFDLLSYAITLSFMRRGLRAKVPLVWGVADLAVACVLFLALGAVLVAVVHWLNVLAGTPLLDLEALFLGVGFAPWDYVWLHLMLFSTILPTALHGLVSLLGVQGIWPLDWRRPVARWVKEADATPLEALRAGLALGVVWTLPVLALGWVGWALWQFAGEAVLAFLRWYFHQLLWIADVPVGVF